MGYHYFNLSAAEFAKSDSLYLDDISIIYVIIFISLFISSVRFLNAAELLLKSKVQTL